MQLIRYQKNSGREPFTKWLSALDNSVVGEVEKALEILRNTEVIESSKFKNIKKIHRDTTESSHIFRERHEVSLPLYEIHAGKNRVYFGVIGNNAILLTGGSKNSQDLDIEQAVKMLIEYLDANKDMARTILPPF